MKKTAFPLQEAGNCLWEKSGILVPPIVFYRGFDEKVSMV